MFSAVYLDRYGPPAFSDTGSVPLTSFRRSFNGRFGDECLNEEVFASLAEARTVLARWRQDYN